MKTRRYASDNLLVILGGITCTPKVDHPLLYNYVKQCKDDDVIRALKVKLTHKWNVIRTIIA